MEYLVTMSTRVPDGTPPAEVDDVRAREAAHTRELAEQGYVLRLWRPPLAPGEWRTIGLFAADGAAQLGRVLASMPLRVWRTDEIQPLAAHPNDPASDDPASDDPASDDPADPAPPGPAAAEFLVDFTPAVPPGTPAADVGEARAREAGRVAELAKQGHVVRLWALPPAPGAPPPAPGGLPSAVGLWRDASADAVRAALAALPLKPYLTTRVTELTPHPSDPAAPGSRSQRVSYFSPADLAEALRQAAAAHGRHEEEIGHADPDWPDWYAAYMVRTRSGADHG